MNRSNRTTEGRRVVALARSASIVRARRNGRASRVFSLLDAGHSKKEIEEITGLHLTTINLYIRTLR